VVEVDVARKRISLSMKTEVAASKPKQERKRENVKPKGSSGSKPAAGRPDQHRKPAAAPQHNKPVNHKPVQKEKKNADGDLQMKLEALKNLFK